jgi:hypothetical protein
MNLGDTATILPWLLICPFQGPKVRDWFWRDRNRAVIAEFWLPTRIAQCRRCDRYLNVSNMRTPTCGGSGYRPYENIGVGQFQTFTYPKSGEHLAICSPSIRWIHLWRASWRILVRQIEPRVAIKDVPDQVCQRRFVLAWFEARLARTVRSRTSKSVR